MVLFAGAEVIVAEEAELLVTPTLPPLEVEGSEVEPLVVDADPVMLGKVDELGGDADPLPVAEVDPEPDTPDVSSTLGRPVTTTELGWPGCAGPVKLSGGRVISGGRRQLPLEEADEELEAALEELLETLEEVLEEDGEEVDDCD